MVSLMKFSVKKFVQWFQYNQRATAEQERVLLKKSLKKFIAAEKAEIEQFSVWEQIESECVPYAQGFLAKFFGANSRSNLRGNLRGNLKKQSSWLYKPSQLLEGLLQPKLAGGVFAASLCLLLVSMLNSSSNQTKAPNTDFAMNLERDSLRDSNDSSVFVPKMVSQGLRTNAAPMLSSFQGSLRDARNIESAAIDGQELVLTFSRNPNSAASNRKSRNQLDARLGLDGSSGLVQYVRPVQSLNPKGLRMGAADIEWIHARAHVEILPADNSGRAPVIWVGDSIQ